MEEFGEQAALHFNKKIGKFLDLGEGQNVVGYLYVGTLRELQSVYPNSILTILSSGGTAR